MHNHKEKKNLKRIINDSRTQNMLLSELFRHEEFCENIENIENIENLKFQEKKFQNFKFNSEVRYQKVFLRYFKKYSSFNNENAYKSNFNLLKKQLCKNKTYFSIYKNWYNFDNFIKIFYSFLKFATLTGFLLSILKILTSMIRLGLILNNQLNNFENYQNIRNDYFFIRNFLNMYLSNPIIIYFFSIFTWLNQIKTNCVNIKINRQRLINNIRNRGNTIKNVINFIRRFL